MFGICHLWPEVGRQSSSIPTSSIEKPKAADGDQWFDGKHEQHVWVDSCLAVEMVTTFSSASVRRVAAFISHYPTNDGSAAPKAAGGDKARRLQWLASGCHHSSLL